MLQPPRPPASSQAAKWPAARAFDLVKTPHIPSSPPSHSLLNPRPDRPEFHRYRPHGRSTSELCAVASTPSSRSHRCLASSRQLPAQQSHDLTFLLLLLFASCPFQLPLPYWLLTFTMAYTSGHPRRSARLATPSTTSSLAQHAVDPTIAIAQPSKPRARRMSAPSAPRPMLEATATKAKLRAVEPKANVLYSLSHRRSHLQRLQSGSSSTSQSSPRKTRAAQKAQQHSVHSVHSPRIKALNLSLANDLQGTPVTVTIKEENVQTRFYYTSQSGDTQRLLQQLQAKRDAILATVSERIKRKAATSDKGSLEHHGSLLSTSRAALLAASRWISWLPSMVSVRADSETLLAVADCLDLHLRLRDSRVTPLAPRPARRGPAAQPHSPPSIVRSRRFSSASTQPGTSSRSS